MEFALTRSAQHRSNLPETLESRRLLSASLPAAASPLAIDSAAAVSVSKGTGFTGEYFIGDNFATATAVRTDARINFDWALGRPDRSIPAGGFSARWTGTIKAPSTGVYTFYTMSDAGTQVIVNGTTVIDNLTATTASTQQGTVSLTAGQPVSIQVEYVSRTTGPSRMKLLWSSSTLHKQVVPTSALFPAAAPALPGDQALTGTYYSGFNFKTQLLTRVEPSSIYFNYGIGGVPDAAIPANEPFSVQWTGNIVAPTTGTYVFETITDDGVRLFVNGDKIIHDWNVHSAKSNIGTVDLIAGQSYPVTMEYFQDGAGHGSAELLWALAGGGRKLKFVQFTAPAEQLAAPLDVTASAFSTSQINLTWDDVTGETGFTVERSSDGGATFAAVGTTGEGVTTFSDTGLTPATPYVYEVIATSGGNNSPASMEASATTLPAALSATVASATVTGTTATISWSAVAGATSYLVERSPDGNTAWTSVGTTANTSLQDASLANATSYFYRVTASNSAVTAPPSNVVTITTVPAAPTLAATTASDSQIDLSWNDVTGETGFIVQQSADGTSGWTQVGTTPQGTTTLPVAGLTGGTTYHFRVLATGAGGDSAPSNVVNPVTTAAPPSFASLTTLYGLTGGSPGLVYSINTTTGALTDIGTLSFGTNAAGRDPISGDFYYVSTGSSTVAISAWDPTNGNNHVINASVPLDGTVALAAFRDDGTFFVATSVGDLYAIDRTTGDATLKGTFKNGNVTLITNSGDLAFGPDGNLYVFTGGQLYETLSSDLAAATGSGSNIPATLVASPGLGSLQIAFGQDGALYGISAAGQLYSGNSVNGPVTPIGSPSGISLGDLASVPLNADLSVTQSASAFTAGSTGTYTINVINSGPDATIAPIQVIDTLPAGLTFVSGAGTGWTFNVNGSVVTMTYSGGVHSGAVPAATLTVQIDPAATSPVVNTVTVSTNIFDQDTTNNSSTISTVVS
jgi:uncharacterized repeat protein (TIGR01451 family)